jgi:hypothetical protein
MSRAIPLGKKEGPRLEFKGAAALKTPETIARGVVALLNADGGEVWVGLREENERAVAIDPISNPEQERRRLEDHLLDTIEPALLEEIEVESQESEKGFVLRVVARPRLDHRPYALLKGSSRQFVIRVGPRSRPMTRQELQESFSAGGATSPSRAEQALEDAKSRLRQAREPVQRAGGQRFWLGLEPTADLDLDLQDPRYVTYLQDPLATGNRRSGWNFVVPYGPGPQLRKDRLVMTDQAYAIPAGRTIIIERHGSLTFEAPLDVLGKGEKREIWPFPLLENPISAFRIARAIYADELPAGASVAASLALLGIRGWKLWPDNADRWLRKLQPFEESEDLLWELVFSAEEIESESDRCGARLVERVYDAFGFRREQMPAEFDWKTGRLILPE